MIQWQKMTKGLILGKTMCLHPNVRNTPICLPSKERRTWQVGSSEGSGDGELSWATSDIATVLIKGAGASGSEEEG